MPTTYLDPIWQRSQPPVMQAIYFMIDRMVEQDAHVAPWVDPPWRQMTNGWRDKHTPPDDLRGRVGSLVTGQFISCPESAKR